MSASKDLISSSKPGFAGWMGIVALAFGFFGCGRTSSDPEEAAAARGSLARKALAGEPTFTTIDFPGARMTSPLDVNAAGDIVGEYMDAAGKSHGFLLSEGDFTSIDFPGAVLTGAFGINPRGDIVGRYQTSNGHFHGFLLSGGTFTSIDVGDTLTRAHGINARDDIVGRYDDPDGTRHGFLLSEGELTSFDFPGAIDTAPWGINPAGDITGRYSSADGKSHGFLLSEGDFTTIDVSGAVETAPSGGVNGSATVRINPRGDIVGTYCAAGPCSVTQLHGFLLSKAKSKDESDKDKSTDDSKFTSFDFPGAIGTLGTGINPRGDIVGIYFDKNGRRHGFLLRSGELNEDADDDGPRDER